MSLPSHFNEPQEYFEECLIFFKKYMQLYQFANIDILVHDVLNQINVDKEKIRNFNVFDKSFNLQEEAKKDPFLNDFFEKLKRLNVFYNNLDMVAEENIGNAPLSPKKKHEIVYLAREIKELCEDSVCDTIVDFGSGLGYLDQLLFETTNCKVLGLECNDSHYVGAKKRQRKYHLASTESVKYIKHTINENSNLNIEEYLKDKFPNHGGFCITGLHACADLTIDAIHLFFKMADAKSLILMPCCYHKMGFTENTDNGRFKNFPLSNGLKQVYTKYEGFLYLRVPFLRLATQSSCVSEDNLEGLVFNLLARGVLQLYAYNHHCRLKRNKRKAVKVKTMCHDFASYINYASTNGFTLLQETELPENSNTVTNEATPPKFDLIELKTMWHDISNGVVFKKAAIFVLIQNYLQPVFENFILYDRLLYLKERGIVNCRYKKIVNEKISPRCLALLAIK